MSGEASRLPVAAALLVAALCLHNLEEALTFARYRERSASLAASFAGRPVSMPTASTFDGMLMAVTIMGLVVGIWAATGPPSVAKRRTLVLFAALLLVNVFAPHIPAAIALGGYAPGVMTAIGINVPVTIVCLRRLSTRQM